MKVTTIGLDIAKQIFQIHGADAEGRAVLRRRLRRNQVAAFFANLPLCVVGLEACGGAHHWARVLSRFGHAVRLIAPQFVKPYVKSNKNDANDADAICEAVSRPQMRFVPAKSVVNVRDLDWYKRLLLAKLEELSARGDGAEALVPGANGGHGDLVDQANSDAEAELQVRVCQSDARLLRAIEEALIRIRQGRFGVCRACKQPISKARLEAVPWTRLWRECRERQSA